MIKYIFIITLLASCNMPLDTRPAVCNNTLQHDIHRDLCGDK